MNISTCLFRHFGPQKEKFSLGVITLKLLPSGNLLLGTGEGKIAEISTPPKGMYTTGPVINFVYKIPFYSIFCFQRCQISNLEGAPKICQFILYLSMFSYSDMGDRKQQQSKAMFKKLRVTKLPGAVTSLALRGHGNQFYAGTARGQMYQVNFEDFSHTMVSSCHYNEVTDVVFPM